MPYEPRTIAFLCELLHPPLPLDPAALQRVHDALFRGGRPVYQSFTVAPDATAFSNPSGQPGAVSQVAFRQDRVQFQEELSGLTTDEFAERLQRILELALAERRIQIFTAQMVTIRSLVNPKSFRDSREFLRDGLFGFRGELEELERAPALLGLRLVFPPLPHSPFAFTLRVESFAADPRSVFLENQGSFGPTMAEHGLAPLAQNVHSTYGFLMERVLPFLARFDARQEA